MNKYALTNKPPIKKPDEEEYLDVLVDDTLPEEGLRFAFPITKKGRGLRVSEEQYNTPTKILEVRDLWVFVEPGGVRLSPSGPLGGWVPARISRVEFKAQLNSRLVPGKVDLE